MIIDSHLHVWSDDIQRYPFAGGKVVDEAGSAELLLETMAAHGVEKAAIVQPIHYLYDNRYVADTLKKYPGKFAAIGVLSLAESRIGHRHDFSGDQVAGLLHKSVHRLSFA